MKDVSVDNRFESIRRIKAASLLLLLAAGLLVLGSGGAQALNLEARPQPDLTPVEVVRTQLDALRANDSRDTGVAVAFRFASPANAAMTGPLPRFAKMIKAGPYALMLRYTSINLEQAQIRGDEARVPVVLVAPGEAAVRFVFYLSRQGGDGELRDCWMTDSVSVEPLPGRPA